MLIVKSKNKSYTQDYKITNYRDSMMFLIYYITKLIFVRENLNTTCQCYFFSILELNNQLLYII